MNRRLLALLLLAAAIIAFVAIASFDPTTPESPTKEGESPAAGRTDVEPEEDPVPSAGGVLVLDRHGRPAPAWLVSADSEETPLEMWAHIGRSGIDGRLAAGDFRKRPRGLLVAFAGSSIGGPVAWDPQGVTIRLGDGCVLSGTVRDAAGNPVPGAAVGGWQAPVTGFAGEDGRYRITGLRPGQVYRIEAMQSGGGWSVGSMGGEAAPGTVEVTFDRLGEEKELDIEIPSPAGRALIVSIRYTTPPQAEPEVRFDLGTKNPLTLHLPSHDTLVRCPASLAAGQEVRVRVRCPGFAVADETVVMPASESVVRVDLTLKAGGLPLHGRVVDAEGDAVAGAEVRACETPGMDGRYHELTVDRDGRFRLRADCAGRHLVAFVKGKSVSPWLHLVPGTTEVVLVVSDACVVQGRVLDRDTSTPVEGATVGLAFEMNGHDEWTTISGDDGSYRFAGIPAGSFVWPFVVSTPRAEAVERGPDRTDAEARSRTGAVEKGLAYRFERDGEVFSRDLPAIRYRGGSCRFVLVPPEGIAVPKVITVSLESVSARWNRTSEWREEIDPDVPTVEIWLGEGRHVVTFRAGVLTGVEPGIEVSADGDLPSRNVHLTKRARVLARLVDRDGNRLPEKDVRVDLSRHVKRGRRGSGNGIGSVMTNGEGEADVTGELPSADALDVEGVTIRFTLGGERYFDAWPFGPNVNLVVPGPELASRLRDSGGEDVIFEVPAWRFLRVPFVVRDAEGNPQAGVKLTCSPAKEFEEQEVVTDARGIATLGIRFEPKSWPFGIRVEAVAPFVGWIGKFNDNECRKRTKDGRTVFLLTVARAREVKVRLVTTGGKPLVNQSVWYRIEFPGERMVTDAAGVVTLQLPEAETKIYFDVEGCTSEWQAVPAGAVTHRYTVRENRTVEVEIVVPKDLAAEKEFRIDPEPDGRAVDIERGADGRYRGRLEIPGAAETGLRVISPDRRWEARVTVGTDDESVKLVLARRKLHPVTFRLLGLEGETLADVMVRPDSDFSSDAATLLTGDLQTDAQGRVTVQLPAGKHDLNLRTAGWYQEPYRVEFTVPVEKEIVLRFRRR